MKTLFIPLLLTALSITPTPLTGQHAPDQSVQKTASHNTNGYFRAALLIGHTLIAPEQINNRLFVPSWGLDLEYWPRHRLGLGIHTDVELQDYIVSSNKSEEIERKSPFIVTFDFLYRPWQGLVLMGGPGWEIERTEQFALFRMGAEYEIPLQNDFDVFPSFFFDRRLDGFSTLSFGLGIGKLF